MAKDRSYVLILAGSRDFVREITENWPQDGSAASQAPEFIVLEEGSSACLRSNHFDVAIADAAGGLKGTTRLRRGSGKSINPALRQILAESGRPAILVHSDPKLDFYKIEGAVLELRREPKIWAAMVGLLGREILSRSRAEAHASEAEKSCTRAQAEATLGRYIVEMRTSINNALTTVLGNAELLVNEPGLPASVQVQSDAIRNMALRLHEVFQRFSSIEKELTVSAGSETSSKKTRAAFAG